MASTMARRLLAGSRSAFAQSLRVPVHHSKAWQNQVRHLNIHEYQGAQLMSKFGANIPKGAVASSTAGVKKDLEESFPNDKERWIELTGRSGIKGTILNSVKGGLAVALAGHIAFLSKSKSLGKPTRQQKSFRILEMKQFQLRSNILVEGMKRNSKWFRLFRESTISTLRVIEGTVLRPKGSNGYLVVIKGRHIAFLPGSCCMSKRLKTAFHIFHMNPMDREIILCKLY